MIMFDFRDFYDRVAGQMPTNCIVCEVGVADGDSALYLAKRLIERAKLSKLYMVDNMQYGGYEQIKKIYENIIEAGLGRFVEVIPYDSIEASTKFNDGFLDFIFIDSSHEYEETKQSIASWYPKVKDSGILAGHDYILYPSVAKAVDELIPAAIVRDDIPDREFEPEQFLHTEDTSRGYGLWWCKKDFYKKIKT